MQGIIYRLRIVLMINIKQAEPKRITQAEREARKVFRSQEAEKALSEYETAQKALHANRERLRAERLAREAAATKSKTPA